MLDQLKIAHRLWLISTLAGSLFLVSIAVGWMGLKSAEKSLKTVYEDRAIPLYDLSQVNTIISENARHILLAFQHDPNGPLHTVHDHPLSMHLEAMDKGKEALDTAWTKFMATYLTDEEKVLAAAFMEKRKAWVSKLLEARGSIEAGNFSAEAMAHFLKAGREEGEAVRVALDQLMAYQASVAKQEFEVAEARARINLWIYIALILIGVTGVLGMSWLTIRRITHSLKQAGAMVDAIASGDLSRPIPPAGSDEIGEMLAKLAAMQGGLRELIGAVRGNVDNLNRAALDLSASSSSSARASETQSEAASSMAASVEQLSVSIDQVEEHAREARGVTQASGGQSEEGGRIIHEAASEMGRIAEAVNATSGTIRQLEDYSGQISSIVNVIKDIADQTNLLALNAAIEAARAGEQGRGFAVVADEVRKLAERTAKSTGEISGMIDKIQQGTQRAAQEMEAGVRRVNEGVSLAHKAGDSVTGIRASAEQVTRVVDDINLALKEQAVAAREIAQKVERIAQGSEASSAAVNQTAASAEQLRVLAGNLQQLAGRFRV
ncbi:MAG: methyl-accepting chemotaxis protein [Pseudomonadota bacterium]|nr:methyl-accepting chemotaxis protein [Pseudomonadota bacterium]MDP1905348.1 methyl-accepting chemotaxis protein [Pseudomonadota bacterium]MDP2353496.1 methyl-accepting chemotaxis protein [Pseudomonadota bacterium]